MSINEENEITVKVTCSDEDLISKLKEKGFKEARKFIDNRHTLIEIETNSKYNTINELKKKIKEIDLPIEKNVYFVKKAEEELTRILQR